MEVTFQNKREDFQAFYDYMVKETEQGKTISRQVFLGWLTMTLLISMLFGFLFWASSGRWQEGFGVTTFFLVANGLGRLLVSRFKPIYYGGVQIYKNQEKSMTPIDLQIFQLPRTITLNDNWLEIQSSEAVHRWRWRRVDKIGLTPNFVFIHVGNCPVVYVPKRDFPSEKDFLEFGKILVEQKEKNKGQPIGAE